jgi:Fungal specific transcription factor domain
MLSDKYFVQATQSASGMWGVHLDGARILLEKAGSLKNYQGSSRIRAQVAMLVWCVGLFLFPVYHFSAPTRLTSCRWDVTIAFISRKEPRLPITYLKTLMKYDEGDNWSFFILNGCPVEFVMKMTCLAKLAAIYEKTTRMEWTTFNRLPVDALVEEVRSFVNVEDANFDDIGHLEEDPDAKRNRFYCIEAWRHAILLYSYRVFTPKQNAQSIHLISHHARVILDSVRCIPHTEVLQKQLLLPVFLAASEAGDERSRSFVRQYCKYWSDVSRFYHFESAALLLEDIWNEWELSTRKEYWWGSKIGSQDWVQYNDGAQPTVSELLLG